MPENSICNRICNSNILDSHKKNTTFANAFLKLALFFLARCIKQRQQALKSLASTDTRNCWQIPARVISPSPKKSHFQLMTLKIFHQCYCLDSPESSHQLPGFGVRTLFRNIQQTWKRLQLCLWDIMKGSVSFYNSSLIFFFQTVSKHNFH